MTTTQSPMKDSQVLAATKKALAEKFGSEISEQIGGYESQDKEDKLEGDIDLVDYTTELGFDKYIAGLLDTKHLIEFDKFDKYIGLDGAAYNSYKKCLWYFAQSLKQETYVYKINYKTKIDNRIHILGIAPPASGKSTSKNKMKKIQEDCFEMSGLSHPQQLIGTTKPATAKKPKKDIPGILSHKLVIHDESQDTLNEKNPMYSACQKIKRQAMDCYGDNALDKKLTGNDIDEATQEYSPSRFLDFAHPVKLESPFFDTGSFRRPFIFDLVADETIDLKSLTEFKLDGDTNYDNYPSIIAAQYRDKKRSVTFNQDTLNIIGHCHATLLRFLLNQKNENAFRYGLLMRYNFRAVISKVVYILALAKNENVPSTDTTMRGCRDAILFILESIKAINKRANMGTTSDVWEGVDEEDTQALMWLFRKKCTSIESTNVSIDKFWTALAHLHGCKKTQARGYYYKLKKNGYVDSWTDHKTSKVWLKFIPKEFKLVCADDDGLDFIEGVYRCVGAKNTILTHLRQIFIEEKDYLKARCVGITGMLGFILYDYILCDEIHNYIDFYNIYNKEGKTPTLPTHPIENTNSPLKNEVEVCQTAQKQPDTPEPPNTEQILESTRDTQYFDAEECKKIQPCSREEVLKYTKNNPDYKLSELLSKFGPGILAFKKEGIIK